jgi:ATP-binding cassette subfamily B protein
MGSDAGAVKDVRIERSVVRRVLGFARPYRTMLIGFVVTLVLAALVSIATPLLIGRIIDDAIPNDDKGLVSVLAGLMLLAALAEALLALGERWWSSRIGEGLIYDLRAALYDHVQRMPLAFFTSTETGRLISRMNNDVIGAQRAMTGTLGSVISNVIVVATTFVALLVLEWRLALMALLLLPLFIVPAKRVGKVLQSITREGMDLNAGMNTTMTERLNVSGALLVKLYGQPGSESQRFNDQAGRVRDIGVRSAMYGRVFVIALTLVGAVGTASVYWIGARLVIDDSLAAGDLVAMGLLVARIYGPLTALTNARVDVMTALVSFERVFEVLDTPNTIVDRPGAKALENPRGAVAFDGVTFAYPSARDSSIPSLEGTAPAGHGHGAPHGHGGHGHGHGASAGNGASEPKTAPEPVATATVVLHDVSFSVPAGTMTALVGPSGSGKSTIASLIPRLYDATTGTISLDGHDVRDLTLTSLRGAVGVVSQDPHLFHESVGSNLRYARADATDDELEAAAKAAHIHDVIAALPDGYDTVVGERGYRLSGGEKQRLAIARMLLKDPALVILDEATSHLDSENEVLVQRALDAALVGRTTLVIAHRLSTITSADEILVLENGHIVERGRHDDLLASGNLYSELYTTLVRGSEVPG